MCFPHGQAFPPGHLTTAVPMCLPTSSHTAPAPRGTPPPALSSPYLQGQVGRQPNHRAARTARTLLLLSTRSKQHADTGTITQAEQGARMLGAQRAEPGPGSASPEPAPRRPWPCWERHAAGHAQLGNRGMRKTHTIIPSQKSTQKVEQLTNAQLSIEHL